MSWAALLLALLTGPVEVALEPVAELAVHGRAQVTTPAGTIHADNPLFSAAGLVDGTELSPVDGELLALERRSVIGRPAPVRRYRGRLRLAPDRGRVALRNMLDLEDYVRGVVPVEIGPGAPDEALRAQAVAARSYALAGRRAVAAEPPRVSGQVYGGADVETPRTNAAVEATAGEVLLAAGRPLEAVYHACCGGLRAAPEEIWGGRIAELTTAYDEPAGTPVNLDEAGLRALLAAPRGWCAGFPAARWTRSATTLRSPDGHRLYRPDPPLGRVLDVRVAERRPSGVIGVLEVEGAGGVARYGPEQVRGVLGWLFQTALPSDLLVLDREGDGWRLTGAGLGHRVGLCQLGARAMAAAGHSYRAILAHYYPGAELGRLD